MKILIDGLNFELQTGTGIKTFTRSVIAALKKEGHSIDILSEQTFPKINHVLPIDAYIAATQSNVKSLNRKHNFIEKIFFNRNYKGEIFLSDFERQLLCRSHSKDWLNINCLRIDPNLFKKAFLRASIGLGISKINKYFDQDILFLTSPIPIRLTGKINILTVHDIIPLSHPWLMNNWQVSAKVMGKTYDYTLRMADKIICVSETSKKELIKRFKVNELKIHVVYQPCRFSIDDKIDNESDHNYLFNEKKYFKQQYILFIGAIEPKKNLFNLLKAMKLNRNLPNLIIVGQFAWSCERERLLIHDLRGRVHHLGFLTDGELEVILKNASVFVFPSITEGFGLPVLEAMWQGVPCVISDIPVFRELFSNFAYFVDLFNPASISEGILNALNEGRANAPVAQNYVREKFSLSEFQKKLNNIINI